MVGIVSDGMIVPAFCGPLGLLPLRIRGKAACLIHGKGLTADLLDGGHTSLTLRQDSGYRMTR